MKIFPNLLTVDSGRANFPLHGGIQDFLRTNLKVPKKHRGEYDDLPPTARKTLC